MPADGPGRRSRLDEDVALLESTLALSRPAAGRPALVLLSGLPGTGKSHFARSLARLRPVTIIESDAVRKALVRRPSYSKAEHERVFSAVHELAERLLLQRMSVVIDATSLKEEHRRAVYEIAERTSAGLLVVELVAPEDVALRRLEDRWLNRAPGDLSDAGPEVYALLREEADPIAIHHVTVDTAGDIGPALDAIASELQAIEES